MPDQLWKCAQRDLSVQVAGAPVDPCVWDHASRVARIVEILALIPELKDRPLDRQALILAALYHDAGWVLQVHAGECLPRDLLLKPTSDIQREMAADWMAERVAKIISEAAIQHAGRIIRQMNNRRTDLIEARVLADAENLDEIGPHTICMMSRKIYAEGKTLNDIIVLWERQTEYRYWPARIKDGFHFDTSRRIAQTRLDKLSRFMNDLRQAVRLEDLGESVPRIKDTLPAAQ